MNNLVALCGHCHRLIHTANSPWTITPTPGGNPTFTPPAAQPPERPRQQLSGSVSARPQG